MDVDWSWNRGQLAFTTALMLVFPTGASTGEPFTINKIAGLKLTKICGGSLFTVTVLAGVFFLRLAAI